VKAPERSDILADMERIDRTSAGHWHGVGLGLATVALLGLVAAMAWLAQRLTHPFPDDPPIAAFVVLCMAAGGAFVVLIALVRRMQSVGALLLIIGVGVALRAVLVAAPAILEDDFYRYLFDGAMVSKGIDPYATPPAKMGRASDEAALIEQAGEVHERINHPHLSTIYPPVAEGAFAVAHWIAPFNVNGLRIIWMVVEVGSLVSILLMLRRLDLPATWSAVYWCNPLVAVYIINMAHMDVLAYGLAAGAVCLATFDRARDAAVVLGLAVGAKLWPVILLPIVLRASWRQRWITIEAAFLFVLVVGAALLPMLVSEFGDSSGLVAYSAGWVNNEALYQMFEAGWAQVFASESVVSNAARGTAAILVGLTALGLAWRSVTGGRDLLNRCVLTLGVMFLLSPTQFPWYYAWMLPFLAVRPRWSLVIYPALLPMYHLQYSHPELAGATPWLQHMPVALLLVVELATRGRFGVWRCERA